MLPDTFPTLHHSSHIPILIRRHRTLRERLGWKNLFLLGLVAEKDRYGYELKKLLIDYYNIYGMTVTTIYRSLKLAEREGWVTGKTQPGEKIEQYLYTITNAGREKLASEIEFYLGQAETALFREFNTAVRFRYQLGEESVLKAPRKRRHALTVKINQFSKYLGGADPNPGSNESAQHAYEHFISERSWANRYLAQRETSEDVLTLKEPALQQFA